MSKTFNLPLLRNYTIIAIACLLIGRYVIQPKQKTKEIIKVVEVEKNVKEEKKKTRTRTKETVKPDGTKVTETDVVEDSTSRETGTKKTNTNSSKTAQTGSGLTLGVLAIKDLDSFQKTDIGVVAALPVFGSLSVVGTADSGKRIGLGLAIEF